MNKARVSIAGLMRMVLGLALLFATIRALGVAGAIGYTVVLVLVVGLVILFGLGAYLASKNVFWRGFMLVSTCYAFLALFLWDQADLPAPGFAGGSSPKLATTWIIDSIHEYLVPPVSAPPIVGPASATPPIDPSYVSSYRSARQMGHAAFAMGLGAIAGVLLRFLAVPRRMSPNPETAGETSLCVPGPARF